MIAWFALIYGVCFFFLFAAAVPSCES